MENDDVTGNKLMWYFIFTIYFFSDFLNIFLVLLWEGEQADYFCVALFNPGTNQSSIGSQKEQKAPLKISGSRYPGPKKADLTSDVS
jgi:hypothetical protein